MRSLSTTTRAVLAATRWSLPGLLLMLGLGLFANPALAGTIRGKVINDLNCNGLFDAGDVFRPFATVQLWNGAGTVLLRETDTDGPNENTPYAYVFGNLPAGQYQVKLTLPAGAIYKGTIPTGDNSQIDSQTILVNLDLNETSSGNHFLYCTDGQAIICGVVFNDPDCDGGPNDGDAPLTGVTVELRDTSGNLVASQVTWSGMPNFDFKVAPGVYDLSVVLPPGFEFCLAKDGYGADLLSDGRTIRVTGRIADLWSPQFFFIREGGAPPDILLGGVKYYDLNMNGVQDPGEPGIPGWMVHVTLSNGKSLVVFTDAAGQWQVTTTDLGEGNEGATFVACEVIPSADWTQTGPIPGSSNVGGTATADAGKCWTGTVLASPVGGLDFGNVCLTGGGGGGRTPGFWTNKNGFAAMNDDGGVAEELVILGSLNLCDGAGNAFNPTTYAQFETWMKNRNAVNMSYQLSAHLAAMVLNVEAGFVKSGDIVTWAGGTITIGELIDLANEALGDDCYTPSGDPNRAYQEKLKNALDAANNNTNFTGKTVVPLNPDGSAPCTPIIYPS